MFWRVREGRRARVWARNARGDAAAGLSPRRRAPSGRAESRNLRPGEEHGVGE